MSFLIDQFLYESGGLTNTYAMYFSGANTNATINRFYSDDRGDAIQRTIRNPNPRFTVSFWVKFDNSTIKLSNGGYEPTMFSIYDDTLGLDRCFYIHAIPTTNKIGVYGTRSSGNLTVYTQSTSTVTTNWMHIAYVYDSTKTSATEISRLYINGVYDSANSSSASTNTVNKFFVPMAHSTWTGKTTFGCLYASNSAIGSFSGSIDEAGFFYTALSDAEVSELYNSGDPIAISAHSKSSFALAWYRFGDAAQDVYTTFWTMGDMISASTMISTAMTATNRITNVP